MSPYLVNRCICHEITFEEILNYARQNGIMDIKELQRKQICSTKCKLCEPYIEMVLESGETAFEPGEYLKRRELE